MPKMTEIGDDDAGRATAETAAETDDDATALVEGTGDLRDGSTAPPLTAPEAPTILLRMRGLPYGANERDVGKFFGGSLVAAYICRRAGQFFFFVFSVSAQRRLSKKGQTFFLDLFFTSSPSLIPLSLQAAQRETPTQSSPPRRTPREP